MIRWSVIGMATLGVVVAVMTSVQANDFEIRVKVELADRQVQTKVTEEKPTAKKLQPRLRVEIPRDKTVRVSWRVENTGKSEELKDVLVHFFVVKQKKTGQAEVPKLTGNVTYEGALTSNFKPHENAEWQWTLNIHDPGSYLLRVETIGLRKKHGHEHYAAMDIVVK